MLIIAQITASDWTNICIAILVVVVIPVVCWAWAMLSRVNTLANASAGLKEAIVELKGALDRFNEHNRDDHAEIWKTVTENRKSCHEDATELWRAINLHGNRLTELDARTTNNEDRVHAILDRKTGRDQR